MIKFDERAYGYKELITLNLLINKSPDKIAVVLYDPPTQVFGMGTAVRDSENAYGCFEVQGVAAEKGYGPFVYDLIMWLANPYGLAPDRFEVSPTARQVWNYYFKNRPDVEKRPIDDKFNPLTPQSEDDWDTHDMVDSLEDKSPLDYVYTLKAAPRHKMMLFNHKEYTDKIGKQVEKEILRAAGDYFEAKTH